jgi:nucleoside-diphosphate-sugar epimerase
VRLLVTGATGFLGRHVVAAATGHTVFRMTRALARESQDEIAFGASPWTLAEFIRAFAICAPDLVFHCAGDTRNWNVRACFEANTVLAAELLKAVAATPRPPRVILIGSASEYGFVPEHSQPVKETRPCMPTTYYGVAKLAQTQLALSAARRGLPVLVVRLFNAVGVGMPSHLALPSFARQIVRLGSRSALRVGDLSARRDFIDVEEAARLLLELAALRNWPWPLVNLCSGQAYRIGAILDELIAKSGIKVSIEASPALVRPYDNSVLVGATKRLKSVNLFPAAPDFSVLLPRLLSDPQLAHEN